MKPAGVGASMRQQNHESALTGRLITLASPVPHRPAVRGIAKDAVPSPALGETIVCPRIEFLALCVPRRRTWVESKFELCVKRAEEDLRCRPLFGAAAVERFVDRH